MGKEKVDGFPDLEFETGTGNKPQQEPESTDWRESPVLKKRRWEEFQKIWKGEREKPTKPEMTSEEIAGGKDLRQRDFDNAFYGPSGPPKKDPAVELERKKVEEEREERSKKFRADLMQDIRTGIERLEKKIKDRSLKSSSPESSDPDLTEVVAGIEKISRDLSLRERQVSGMAKSEMLKVIELYRLWEDGEIDGPNLVGEFQKLGIY